MTNPHPPVPRRDMLCVVLSYNGYEDTVACLDSLRAQHVTGFDLLVIDNASKQGIAPALASAYPDVELIALAENKGWAGGNNVGIRLGLERGYRWICLLNNDTVFPEGQAQAWISAALDCAPCLLHPAIYYWDEPKVAQLHPALDGRQSSYTPLQDGTGRQHMNFAYGACLAVHRDIFEKIGLFDERFFLQLEETDFHLRAENKGFRAICDDSIIIFHKESRAFGGTRAAIKTYYSTRNTLLLIEKNYHGIGGWLQALKRLYWSLSHLAAATECQPQVRNTQFLLWVCSRAPSARAARHGVFHYLTRRFGKVSDVFRTALATSEKSYRK
ncbi:glycosyltransferase family 2 protein [Massilia sp. DWR3-1-1]|uniref:glycosyltransferase family 2 protein n=1 Tax=Massilia sp. DWR3-1-1 TaxID=2804559 RepID=UPI003CED825B